ncbi:unnamed protein product [Dibothriocephalus latus]|uniref:Mannosyltransferase n=1 Tax=Dibothriocephalus latus TaxID=60516 RepID=A0A3P6TYB5_DIBLA|nr:unnamed protein product [Dibothriocephalus latus]
MSLIRRQLGVWMLSGRMSGRDSPRTASQMKNAAGSGDSDELQKLSNVILPVLILFRIVNALIIRTTFVPDEYWQSVEVAHRWTFGYGALTWEWWNSTAIRSPLHPLMFAGLYKLLAAVGLDSRLAIIYLPRLLHGILAAVADYNLYCMTHLLSGPTTAKLNFLRFNLLTNGANFYGVEPWHWYFTNGLPTMLFSSAAFVVAGFLIDFTGTLTGGGLRFFSSWRPNMVAKEARLHHTLSKFFGLIVAWTVLVYSYLAHKEYRFIFPILPLLHYFAGRGLVCACNALNRRGWKSICCVFSPKTALALFLVLSHVPLAMYTCLVHQRGPTELMGLLGSQGDRNNWPSATPLSYENGKTLGPDEQVRALFLMPCHTTPYISYLHRNISLRLLACDPDLSALTGGDPAAYVDEAEVFYADPLAWLKAKYSESLKLPHFIAMFDQLLLDARYGSGVADFLKTRNYFPCARLFHAHFPTHRRHGKYIHLFCRRGSPFQLN